MVKVKNLSIFDKTNNTFLVEGLDFNIPDGLVYIESENSDKLFELLFTTIYGIGEKVFDNFNIKYDEINFINPAKEKKLSIGNAYTQISGLFDKVEDELKNFSTGLDKDFKIEELFSRNLYSLSGGELQKIILIRNSPTNSDLILLHNQFAELDKNNKKLMLEIFRKNKLNVIVYDKIETDYFKYFDFCLRFNENDRRLDEINYNSREWRYSQKPKLESKDKKKTKVQLMNINFSYTLDKNLFVNRTINFNEGLNFLVGENGSGKTTIFKILTGVIKNFKGEIAIDKIPLNKYLKNNRIGIAFQNPELSLFNLNVKKELTELFNNPNSLFEETLNDLGINKILNKEIGELDFNQKKKLTLLQTLNKNPELLLFDEPTQNFSISERRNIIKFIQKLINAGKTIIIITHSEDFIEGFNDTPFTLVELC